MMDDAQIYHKYINSYWPEIASPLLTNTANTFEVIAQAIKSNREYLLNYQIIKEDCLEALRAIHISSILKAHLGIIIVDVSKDKIFTVGDYHFDNIDEALKAVEMKAFL